MVAIRRPSPNSGLLHRRDRKKGFSVVRIVVSCLCFAQIVYFVCLRVSYNKAKSHFASGTNPKDVQPPDKFRDFVLDGLEKEKQFIKKELGLKGRETKKIEGDENAGDDDKDRINPEEEDEDAADSDDEPDLDIDDEIKAQKERKAQRERDRIAHEEKIARREKEWEEEQIKKQKEKEEEEKFEEEEEIAEDPEKHVSPNAEKALVSNKGTGPKDLGYVLDVVHDQIRAHKKKTLGKTPEERQKEQDALEVLAEKKVANLLYERKVSSCRYVNTKKNVVEVKEICLFKQELNFYLHNSAPFTRIWCGVPIKPHTAIKLTPEQNQHIRRKCSLLSNSIKPVNVLDIEQFPPPIPAPSTDGNGGNKTTPLKGVEPIIIKRNYSDGKTHHTTQKYEDVPCNVPCKKDKTIEDLIKPEGNANTYENVTNHLVIDGTNWVIVQTLQPYSWRKAIHVDQTDFHRDVYSSTLSHKSDIPLSYYDFAKHDLHNTQPLKYGDATKKASYIVSDSKCESSFSRRHRWYEEIEKAIGAVSYGSCNHNTNIVNSVKEQNTIDTAEGRIKLMRKYMFSLGFEKAVDKDWITELTWESLKSGALPVILGAKNLQEHLPAIDSVVYVDDYQEWDKLTNQLEQIVKNQTLYESYHRWRTDEKAIERFDQRYNFTKTNSFCRMCRWAYAKKYGLGWDQEQQQIRDNHIPKTGELCFDTSIEDSPVTVEPFLESWILKGKHAEVVLFQPTVDYDKHKVCIPTPGSSTVEDAIGTLHKTRMQITKSISNRDGVVDMDLRDVHFRKELSHKGVVTLRLGFHNMTNENLAYFINTHEIVVKESHDKISNQMLLATSRDRITSITLQDRYQKITVLSDWKANMYSYKESSIDIDITHPGDEIKRMRIIMEDMNQLHDKMTEHYPSTFAKRMMYDFMEPLELYYEDKDL